MKRRILLLLLIMNLQTFAQDSFISVDLIPPPPGELNLSSFNNAIIITNEADKPIKVKLMGMVAERSDGIIFDGSTSEIEIPPGVTYINEENAGKLTMTYNPEYREAIIRTGNAPAGSYTFCISVVSAEIELKTLAKNCLRFELEKPSPPELVSPVDGLILDEELPVFTWTPPMPMVASSEVRYRFIIAEIYDFQTSYEAMISNPWFIEENVVETSLVFPIGARKMISGTQYCWMVQSLDPDGNPIGQNDGRSEIFRFVYNSNIASPAFLVSNEQRSIMLLDPVAECIGNVTQHVNNPVVSFKWSATGDFTNFNIILYDNPCGKYPQPPSTPPKVPPTIPTTPPGTPPTSPPGTPPIGPVTPPVRNGPDDQGGPGGVKPVTPGGTTTTTPGETDNPAPPLPPGEPVSWDDDDLGGTESLPPLPPGWKWGPAGPYWTGESPPEPPALPPGWEWGPLRPVWVGEGNPPPRVVLGSSGSIPVVDRNGGDITITQSFDMNIADFVQPGAAFICQIQGTTILPDGTTQNILSEPQCLRYIPINEEGNPVEEVGCPENSCGVESEMLLKLFGMNVYPTVMMKQLPDDPLSLKVFAYDQHCLVQKCYCKAGVFTKIHDLIAKVRYEWEIISGEGGFIKINESGETKKEFGQVVAFNPPEIVDTTTEKTIQLKITAYHDDPTKGPDHAPLTAYLTVKIKREIKDKGKWDSNAHEFVDPGEIEDWYVYNFDLVKPDDISNKCPDPTKDECYPLHQWEKESDLDGDITLIPDEACSGDYVRFEAKGSDTDLMKLICVPTGKVCTLPDEKKIKFNDFIEYIWTADKGIFTNGAVGREVVWQAPDEEGDVNVTLTIKDNGGQYDDKDKTIKKKIRVNKLGIDMVKVDKDWIPEAANGKVPGYVKPMIYVCKKGKWEANGRRKIIYTKLKNISREPGVCMNFPPQPPNLSANILLNRNPDMFFDEEKNKDEWILMKDTATSFSNPTKIEFDNDNPSHSHHYLSAASKKKTCSSMPTIRVEDYGAYCKTEAKANHCKPITPKEDKNDPPCKATNDCCTGDNTVKLPRDENNNDIADGARQDENGALATKDEDLLPAENPLKGDGLTNYQEYRGFIYSIGKNYRMHWRTNTTLKDLYIRNEKNLPLDYFEKSNLILHEINENSLWQLSDLQLELFSSDPDSTTPADQLHPVEINYNRCKHEKHCPKTNNEDDWGEQHGVWLDVNDAMAGLYGVVECDKPRFDTGEYFIIPKIVYKVLINRQAVLSKLGSFASPFGGVINLTYPNSLEKTVAHELGHSINVKHHGDKRVESFAPGGVNIVGNTIRDAAGNVVNIYQVYGRNGQTSGPTDCVMLYDNRDGWYNTTGASYFYNDKNGNGAWDVGEYRCFKNPIHKYSSPQIVGNTFCETKPATNWNKAPNNGGAPTLPVGVEGNLDNPSDKNGCRQQIRVKSWKLNP